MLLDAGLSPKAPMPYIVDNGEKANSLIGLYRDYYQNIKMIPNTALAPMAIKPLLDMLETADKHASNTDTGTPPSFVDPQIIPAAEKGDDSPDGV